MARALGVRREYAEVPTGVRSWVDEALGSAVVWAHTQLGGMSPGCAARVRTRDGSAAFVKAVGTGLNAATAGLFRHEIDVLSALPAAPYRSGLLATYDDGDWVALLLADIDGRIPDLSAPDTADAAAVWHAVTAQSTELTRLRSASATWARSARRPPGTWPPGRSRSCRSPSGTCRNGRYADCLRCSPRSATCQRDCRRRRFVTGTCERTICSCTWAARW